MQWLVGLAYPDVPVTCEPPAGWRHVAITERRTMQDFAHHRTSPTRCSGWWAWPIPMSP